MKIVVTGATGYIGDRFVKKAHSLGYEIVALCRRLPELDVCDWISYDLLSSQGPVLPLDTDFVLHFATSKSLNGQQNSAKEILAAELLISSAQSVGAKLIFLSSQTARPDAPTAYGRTKWHIEQLVLAIGGCVIRPGQVYGGKPRGLFGELLNTVRHMPILPVFLPAPNVQPIHVDDLSLGLLRIVERVDICHGVVCLGSIEAVTFTEFLSTIARVRLRVSPYFVPVPSFLVAVGIRFAGKNSNFERLLSLFDLPRMATETDLQKLGLLLRPLNSGMHRAGDDKKRNLIIEGRALLSYVLKRQPGSSSVRNYVRSIESLRVGNPIELPLYFVRWPVLLSIIDCGNPLATSWDKEFVWRLNAATVLAEATTFGAQRFLGLGESSSFVVSLFGIIRAILTEAGWWILSLLLAPSIRVVLKRKRNGQR
jgi:nucleoside-diphosphate-sugar epimerase